MKTQEPPRRKAAPAEDSGPLAESAPGPAYAEADDIVAQLKRRREATKRLPPLANGKRDPWDLETYYDPARGGAA